MPRRNRGVSVDTELSLLPSSTSNFPEVVQAEFENVASDQTTLSEALILKKTFQFKM